MKHKFIDLVIAGPDFSGTTTQISDIITHLRSKDLSVRDLRGTEIDALFHTEDIIRERERVGEGSYFLNLTEYLEKIQKWRESGVTTSDASSFLFYVNKMLGGHGTNRDLRVASMVKNDITTYINPDSADVWILEEPTRRGAGQVCRVIEQNRSKFGSHIDGRSAAMAHQAYRTDEFLRFRKPLRDAGKIIIRSRSEESACYQIYDRKCLSSGIRLYEYLRLPGHEVAFHNPPTHIFVVCGPKDWDKDEYLRLKAERTGNRVLDDHEKNVAYQLLVNRRYASNWINNLYRQGCYLHHAREPEIIRFDIYNDKETTKKLMTAKLDEILNSMS